VARPPWFALALISVVVLLLAWWAIPRIIESRRWHAYQVRLQDEPGIVVTQVGQREGKRYVAGLRDPLAPDPQMFLDTVGLDPQRVESRWDPYISLLPDLILRRARANLDPPAGLDLSLRDGVLIATGAAPTDWIDRARHVAPTIPGVVGFVVADQVLSDLAAEIQRRSVFFAVGSDTPNIPEAVEEIAGQVRALDVAAQARGRSVTVEVRGSTDDLGDSLSNARLALARAQQVRAMLLAAGVGRAEVRATRGPLAPPTDPGNAVRARYRRVSFSIILTTGSEGSP
jgi:OOP family OmpA-OmpF porin